MVLKKSTKIIIIIVLLVLYIIFLAFHFSARFYKTYTLGDYGVTLKAPISFEQKKDTKDLLTMYDAKDKIMLNCKELKGDFWKSDNMDEIMDGYIRLISAMNYDCNVKDVTLKAKKIHSKEVGLVGMTLDKFGVVERLSAVLTHKENGYIAIEIYGRIGTMNEKKGMVNRIIKSIDFTTNTHDYSKDSEVDRSKLSGDIVITSWDVMVTSSGEVNNGGNDNE